VCVSDSVCQLALATLHEAHFGVVGGGCERDGAAEHLVAVLHGSSGSPARRWPLCLVAPVNAMYSPKILLLSCSLRALFSASFS
jgi:hypothetical protein